MHNEVAQIRSKMLSAPWPKFLNSVSLNGFRGWTGEEVEFKFPVAVLTGENGSGKSTILMAAAAAYQDPRGRVAYSPSSFFKTTPWDQYGTSTIRYKIREGTSDRTYSFRKPTERWRMSGRPRREVLYSTIARTLPIEETVGSAAIASSRASEAASRDLDSTLARYYSSILGRSYQRIRLARADVSPNRELGIVTLNGQEFSAFHQGAGEAATLDLMRQLGRVQSTALLVIDEVEASLHPRAQRRLVHFLLWLARSRHIQVIMSTHSQYVLDELPPEARIFLNRSTNGVDVLYGVSTAFALTRMDDYRCPDLYVFVEDEESEVLFRTILLAKNVDLTPLKILPAGPADMVLNVASLSLRQRLPMAALGVVDGDTTPRDGAIALPGTLAPELIIFPEAVKDVSPVALRLGVAHHAVEEGLRTAMTLTDHHQWIGHFASQIDRGRSYVWETLCDWWVREKAQGRDLDAVSNAVAIAIKAAQGQVSSARVCTR